VIVARAKRDNGGEILMLGLSHENLRRIHDGKPLHVRREAHGDGIPEGWEIVIFTGKDEFEMQRVFQEGGLIGPETKVHVDPRLGSQ